MGELLLKPRRTDAGHGVTIMQQVKADSPLRYVALTIAELAPGGVYAEQLGKQECCVVVLQGTVDVAVGEERFSRIGARASVFERKPTDSVYVSNDRSFQVEAQGPAQIALCYAPSTSQLPTRLIRAAEVGTETRGILNNRRLVHNILPDSDPGANSLLVVEVFTEGGNWSSYPPHKHDQDNLPHESQLEETYYHEISPSQGFVVQRVYTDDLSLDETMTVRHGDVVLVTRGYHPVGVPDGYTSYYLNVMAGPRRVWKFHNEPDHEWILGRQSK